MLKIITIPCLTDNYSYLLHETVSDTVAIVDPSDFQSTDKIIEQKFKKLDFILNTHHHADHIGGNQGLKEKYKSKILAHKLDKERIPNVDRYLIDGEDLNLGNIFFKIIFVPGHTKGHIAFYSKVEKIVFTGDTLFSLGCGRIFEGTNKEMFNSLKKLKELPADTKIYCGHEYTKKNLEFCLKYDVENKFLNEKKNWVYSKSDSNLPTVPCTVGDEQKTNIFFRCNDQSIKDALNMNNASEEAIFSKLRDLKDSF